MKEKPAALPGREGLSPGGQVAVFALVLLMLFSRCPSRITHPQFFAEDGLIFFAQAYNLGWSHTVLMPQVGYLYLVARLGAGLALLVPLAQAPLVTAVVAMLVQALPVPILLSQRCRDWGSLPFRLGLAAIYLAVPNVELHVVLTNTQWHLAVAGALIAFASSPQTWYGRAFDAILLLTFALSGPFAIILAPMVLIFWWVRRQPWSLPAFALIAVGAGVQLMMLLEGGPRAHTPLGASVEKLLRMMGGDVVAGALLGGSSFPWRAPMAVIVTAALAGLSIYLYCLWFANLEWKLFLIFCGLLLAASLCFPLTEGSKPAWDSVLLDVSARYWFLPMLAFTWSALWCARYGRDRLFKIAGICTLFAMLVGVVRDWRYAPFPDAGFAGSVQRMRDAKPGEHVVLPIPPDGWHMELVKK